MGQNIRSNVRTHIIVKCVYSHAHAKKHNYFFVVVEISEVKRILHSYKDNFLATIVQERLFLNIFKILGYNQLASTWQNMKY